MEASGRKSEAAIAEFNALRAEILSHLTAQTAVVGLGVTALGIIVGFVVKEGADDRLLLVVPPLGMFVILLHVAESYRMTMLGDYIRNELWPFLQKDAEGLPSWEGRVAQYRSSKSVFVKTVVIDSPAIVLFLAASASALIWVWRPGEVLWWAGWAMTAIALVVPIAIGLSSRSNARTGSGS